MMKRIVESIRLHPWPIAVMAILVALVTSRAVWLPAAGHWLDVGQPPEPTDYCLVLSGDVQSRPFVAAALYRHGFVRRQIWLTRANMIEEGGIQTPDGNQAAVQIMTTLGVPPEKIITLDGGCAST